MVHAGLCNIDETIDWLDNAIDARQSHVVYLERDAKFDPLRDDPRFGELLRRGAVVDLHRASGLGARDDIKRTVAIHVAGVH